MRCSRRVSIALAAALCAMAPPARADEEPLNPGLVPPAPLHEQVQHMAGEPERPADLIVTVYTPPGEGPFPLAVMNHGASGSTERPGDMKRYRYSYAAYYFLSRGYAVAMPMMRGYGGSTSRQTNHGCELSDMAIDNGRDIAAIISALRSDARFDPSRIVVAGQSFGGWNTLGLGAVAPPGVAGLIDFFGGVHSSGCTPEKGDEREALISAARRLGAATSIPSLWIYGENDSMFPRDTWAPMYRAYVEAGGHAQLVDVGRFMDDSHQLLSHEESLKLWVPTVDAFLASVGLPAKPVHPDYLPLPWPKPTHFAGIDDADAVPWITPQGRESYRTYINLGTPKVFLIAPGGQSAIAHGGFDPLGRAYAACRAHNLACLPYALDDDVVWVPPPAYKPPVPTNFAAIGDIAAVPWLSASGRQTYAHFLAAPLPRAFVIAPGGQSVATQGGTDPLGRAMALCWAYHFACRAYAVDNAVVWAGAR